MELILIYGRMMNLSSLWLTIMLGGMNKMLIMKVTHKIMEKSRRNKHFLNKEQEVPIFKILKREELPLKHLTRQWTMVTLMSQLVRMECMVKFQMVLLKHRARLELVTAVIMKN